MPEGCWNASESFEWQNKNWQRNEQTFRKKKKNKQPQIKRCSQYQEQWEDHANSAICHNPDLGRYMGCLSALSLAYLCVSSQLNNEHSRGLDWVHLSQNNLRHQDGQQNLQPCAFYCPETALPVLSPGQSISAEFGTSSRGRKRARRTSPVRQKNIRMKRENRKELQ